jgi:TRAP-type C4-dicarboxylate transport system permease small subunit
VKIKFLKRIGHWLIDLVEIYVPVTVFSSMFIVFLMNIFLRYVVRNPIDWGLEFSVNAFVIVGLLGACLAYRREDHVVFDLVYNRLTPRGQNMMRIFSHALVIGFILAALPSTIHYLWTLPAITSIMRIPDKYIFSSLFVLFLSSICRSAYRLILDIKVLRNRTYVQAFNSGAKEI